MKIYKVENIQFTHTFLTLNILFSNEQYNWTQYVFLIRIVRVIPL